MKQKAAIPLLLAVILLTAASRAGAQPADDPLAPANAGSEISVDEARAAYLQAEEKVAIIKAVGLSTTPKKSGSSADEQENPDTGRVPVLAEIPVAGRLFRNDAELRKTLRPVVVESFVARQRLQQAELAELRRRLAEIEQSLVERQNRMDAIVDSRVDDLLAGRSGQAVTKVHARVQGIVRGLAQVPANDGKRIMRPITVGDTVKTGHPLVEIECEGAGGNRVVANMPSPIDGIIIEKNVNVGDVVKPSDTLFQISAPIDGGSAAKTDVRLNANEASARSTDEFDIETRERLAEVDVQAAQDEYDAADQGLKRARSAYETGSLTESALATYQKDLRQAKAELDRAKLKLAGLWRKRDEEQAKPRLPGVAAARSQPDSADQFDVETRQRLAQADFEEAQAVCDAAQYDYKAHVEANKHAPGSTPIAELKSLQAKVRIAEAQLQRAKVKLDGFETERGELEATAEAAVVEAEAEKQKAAAVLAGKMASRDSQMGQLQRAEAELGAAVAKHNFEKKQYEYVQKLRAENAVSTQEVDLRKDGLDAAEAAVSAAKSVIATAKANVVASEAAIDEARADVTVAEARLRAAQARRDRLLHRQQNDESPAANAPAGSQPKPETPADPIKKL